MRIKREVFAVAHGVRRADGQKGEPEEQPTRVALETAIPVSLSAGGAAGPAGPTGKTMRGVITHDAPAGELAQELAAKCGRCKHMRRKAWQALVAECDFPTAPLMKRQAINEVRSALLLTKNAKIAEQGADAEGDFDVENALRSHMGLCSVLSDIRKDYVVVHQLGCCPQTQTAADGSVVAVKTKAQPVGFFQPRDSEARKEAEATRDNILNAASGKGTTL